MIPLALWIKHSHSHKQSWFAGLDRNTSQDNYTLYFLSSKPPWINLRCVVYHRERPETGVVRWGRWVHWVTWFRRSRSQVSTSRSYRTSFPQRARLWSCSRISLSDCPSATRGNSVTIHFCSWQQMGKENFATCFSTPPPGDLVLSISRNAAWDIDQAWELINYWTFTVQQHQTSWHQVQPVEHGESKWFDLLSKHGS